MAMTHSDNINIYLISFVCDLPPTVPVLWSGSTSDNVTLHSRTVHQVDTVRYNVLSLGYVSVIMPYAHQGKAGESRGNQGKA